MPARIVSFFRSMILGSILFQAGCGGGTPPPAVDPQFLIVINQNATGTGLAEYPLPLTSNAAPTVTWPSQGVYMGGVVDQYALFVFGTSSGTPTLWRYLLPLSTAPAPAALTGLGGTPVSATGISGGSLVVFLEQYSPTQACLEVYSANALLGASPGSLPTPNRSCLSDLLSPPTGSTRFLGGAIQLSTDGSDLFVEEVYQTSGGPVTRVQTYSPSLFSLVTQRDLETSYGATVGPLMGVPETGNVVLLLPDPSSTPAVDFYSVTGLLSGSGPLGPIYAPSLGLSGTPSLLTIDAFGSYLFTAQTTATGPTISSFSLNDVQNGSNDVSPLAQTGAGLTPSGLVVIVSSSG